MSGSSSDFKFEFRFWMPRHSTRLEPDVLPSLLPSQNSSICQSQSTCRFQLAHHAVLHRPWPNHTDTEKIHRLIISLPRRKWVFNTTSKSFERGSHHKTLPHVMAIGSRVWSARLATNPRIKWFQIWLPFLPACDKYVWPFLFFPLLVKPMSFLPNFCA